MAEWSIKQAREILGVVIGPEDLVAKVPEFKFGGLEALLEANGLPAVPPLPSKEKCLLAKEQNKGLIFRVGKDSAGQTVNLIYLKERFGPLIYSSWYVATGAPFALEPLQAGWALADLDPMPGSNEKTYEEQIAYVKEKGCRLKSPVADVYDLLVTCRVTGKFFRGAPLNARTGAVVDKVPIKISHFDKHGMAISTGWSGSVKHAEIGTAAELILE